MSVTVDSLLNQVRAWFLEIAFVREVGMRVWMCVWMCVCVHRYIASVHWLYIYGVCVCPPLRPWITSGVI